MKNCLGILHTLVWGAPALVLILGVGLYLNVTTGFAQITLFPRAVSALIFICTQKARSAALSCLSARAL